jgi:hypothetical protein
MFLFWATANRTNPNASHRRSGIHERLYGDEIRGWNEMSDAIDAAGEFLWTYRAVLDRYARKAIGRFGPGEGNCPSEQDDHGREVPVEGGTYPYWSLGEGGDLYLEDTSDAILEACRTLAAVARHAVVLKLVRDTSAAARPKLHVRWYTDFPVNWSYLSTLDSLISRIKSLRVELALPPHIEEADPPQPEVVTPDAQSVADVVVLFMVTRDLVRIGRDYPDAMPAVDHKAWVDEVTAHATLILKRPGFEGINTLMQEPTFLEMDVAERFEMLMSVAMMAHPVMAAPAGTPAEIQAAVEKAMSTCQATASQSVQAQVSRLTNLMEVSCRCPTGTAVKGFADTARFLQLLHRYWILASAMVHTQRLPAVHKALLAEAETQARSNMAGPAPQRDGAPAPKASPAPPPKTPPTPPVVLGRRGERCTANGEQKKPLTDGQYAVVAALIEAGEEGLTKDAIEEVRPSARRILGDLRKDSDWASVIIMPGQTNGRYRVRT